MSLKTVNIKGLNMQGKQFVVKTDNQMIRNRANASNSELNASSLVEY